MVLCSHRCVCLLVRKSVITDKVSSVFLRLAVRTGMVAGVDWFTVTLFSTLDVGFKSTTKCFLSIFSGFHDWSAEGYGKFAICSFSHDRVKTFSTTTREWIRRAISQGITSSRIWTRIELKSMMSISISGVRLLIPHILLQYTLDFLLSMSKC